MKDRCVNCKRQTPYDFETNINDRYGYVEGVGQLCRSCYDGNIDDTDVCVPNFLILDTPNDQELGEKVRKLFYDKNINILV
jgi:hypothetical protein